MDWRRGFIRLWLVASLCWIGYIGWSTPNLKESALAIWNGNPNTEEIATQRKEADAIFGQLENSNCSQRSFSEMSDECLNVYFSSIEAMPDKDLMNRDQAWVNVRATAVKASVAPVVFAGVLLLLLWVTQGFRSKKSEGHA